MRLRECEEVLDEIQHGMMQRQLEYMHFHRILTLQEHYVDHRYK